jgi:hypothetical protein
MSDDAAESAKRKRILDARYIDAAVTQLKGKNKLQLVRDTIAILRLGLHPRPTDSVLIGNTKDNNCREAVTGGAMCHLYAQRRSLADPPAPVI